jgi:hypothetical protein
METRMEEGETKGRGWKQEWKRVRPKEEDGSKKEIG